MLSFGVLGGTSASLLFNPSLAAIGHWFAKRRAFATGVACTAGGIGGIVFPLVILYLAPTVGFPWALRVIALLCAVVLAVACTTLRKRLPDNKRAGAAIDLVALRDAKFAATTLAIFLVEFAVFIPYTYISSYALHAGMSPQRAYLLNALLNAGAVPGRVLPGYVADRFGVFNTMCATSSTCAVFILALWYTAGGGRGRRHRVCRRLWLLVRGGHQPHARVRRAGVPGGGPGQAQRNGVFRGELWDARRGAGGGGGAGEGWRGVWWFDRVWRCVLLVGVCGVSAGQRRCGRVDVAEVLGGRGRCVEME